MGARTPSGSGCGDGNNALSSFRVESVISLDERGQMILPKEVREKAKIRPGDKLAVVSWGRGEEVCCISLIKAQELAGMVQDLLGPLMKELLAEERSAQR